MPETKKVVIVGAQFAGRRVKQMLGGPNFDVTVVDAKEYFEFTPGVLRCLVQPAHSSAITVQHPESVLVARAVAVEARGVDATDEQRDRLVLDNGSVLEYDYLVLATGSTYVSPIKPHSGGGEERSGSLRSRLSELEAAAAELKEASTVIVVGGGAVGVELAAEVAATFGGQKQIKLITSRSRLLDRMPRSASDYAEAWLRRRGVQLVFGERVEKWPSHPTKVELVTTSGQVMQADLIYNCTGYSAFSTDLFTSLLKSSNKPSEGVDVMAASQKGIPVLCTLQVEGHPNVFVCGDAMSTSHEKTAYSADLSANLVAENIVRLKDGKLPLQYPEGLLGEGHVALPVVQCISLHRWSGVFQFNSLVLTGPLAAVNKAFIEWILMKVAAGFWPYQSVWLALEQSMTWIGCRLFVSVKNTGA